MSLTIFVHRKKADIGLIRWFRDPKFRIDYACGPVMQMNSEQFRDEGFNIVKSHFEEYSRKRVSEAEVQKVFREGEARTFLKDRKAVSIWQDDSGQLWMGPLRIEKFSLSGLVDTGKENHRSFSAGCNPQVFWGVFDAALAMAE